MLVNRIGPTCCPWHNSRSTTAGTNQSKLPHTFYLNTGRHPRTPSTVERDDDAVPEAVYFTSLIQSTIDLAKKCLTAAQDRQKVYADQHRMSVRYKVGDSVLLSSRYLKTAPGLARKFLPKWAGPFEIVEVIDKTDTTVAVKLKLPDGWRIHDVFHVSLVRPYRSDGTVQPPPPELWLTDDATLYVERILAHREKRIRKETEYEYFVKWAPADSQSNTWEDASQIPETIVLQYWENLGFTDIPVPNPKRTSEAPRMHLRPRVERHKDAPPNGGEDRPEGEEV